jgi:outer membrane protein TolC
MELAKKKIIETQNAYLNMKTNYSYLEKQYDLGLIPKLSLDEAKLGLDQAHASYVKATYDYYLATREVTLAQKAIFISVR